MAKRREAAAAKLSSAGNLPEIEASLRGLAAGHRRAIVSMILRLLAVAFLIALFSVQIPAVRHALPLVNAAGVALIVWPFFTTNGRLYNWRLSLGRRYAEAQLWAETERILAPVAGVRAALFDAGGEGRYYCALALRAQGRTDEAARLLNEVASQYARTEWGMRASASLSEASTPVEAAASGPV